MAEIQHNTFTLMPQECRLNRRALLQTAAAWGLAVPIGLRSDAHAAAPEREVRDVGLTAQLFLDDWCVDSTKGLERRLHRPTKAGLIQEADGRPWDRGGVCSLVRDRAGRFHMTYWMHWWDSSVRDLSPNIGDDKAHWFRMDQAYATSDDGIRWTKPVLGLRDGPTGFRKAPQAKWKDGMFEEPTGISKENNLGCPIHSMQDLVEFGGLRDQRRRYLVRVLERDDTHAFAKVTGGGLYFASDVPDFRNDPDWRKRMELIWEGARRGPRGDEVIVAGFDEKAGVWLKCDQSSFGDFQRRGGRDISRWTSRELKDWSAEELVLPIAPDESRDPKDFVEYMTIEVHRVSDFWLGFLNIFHGDRTDPQGEMPTQRGIWRKGLTELRLVMTRDAGKSWQRVGGKQAWLGHHDAENGYDRLIGMRTAPVRVGDELWLYYGCWDGDHLSWNKDGTTYYRDRMRTWRTARAVLRWDGYVSLHAGESPGELTTKPLASAGRRLEINAAASKGSVRVEVQDADGKPLPGFALADCDRCTGDGVSRPVRWHGQSVLPPRSSDRPLRLRFEVHQADLYGFQFRNG